MYILFYVKLVNNANKSYGMVCAPGLDVCRVVNHMQNVFDILMLRLSILELHELTHKSICRLATQLTIFEYTTW